MCDTNKECHCGCPEDLKEGVHPLNDPLEQFIKRIGLGPGLLVKFKNDPQEYVVNNVSPNRLEVFVKNKTQLATFAKKIKDIIAVNRKPVAYVDTMYTESLVKRLESLTGKKIVLEAKEADKIGRDAFLYMDPKGSDKKAFAQCGTCVMSRGKTCAILGPNTYITDEMSCGLYLPGDPIEELKDKELKLVTSKEAGLVDRKVRCENCKSFDSTQNTCLLFEALNKLPQFKLDVKVDKQGCCNAQMPKE